MRLLSIALVLLPLGLALSWGRNARAQYAVAPPRGEPSEADISRARERYVEGGRLVEGGRWSDALSAYEESFTLSGVPAALFNAATTLRSMGRHRDARDLFRQVLALDELDEETRAQSESRMHEEAGRVALILLTGLAPDVEADVALDGRSLTGPRTDPVQLETDAGEHTVSVLAEGHAPWREAVTLSDGQRATVHVELTEISTEQLHLSPLFWSILAIVLAGGGVVAGFLLQDAAQLRPRESFGGIVVEL